MRGYILETVAGCSLQRDGKTFWSREGARREAERIVRRGKAVEVRIVPVDVGVEAVDSVTASGDVMTEGPHAK